MYRELCLIHLSKESLFLNGIPKINLMTLLCTYIHTEDKVAYNLNEIRNFNSSFQVIEGNRNSNNRIDYISTLLEGTELFIHQGRVDEGIIKISPRAKHILDYFVERPINNCEEPLNTANRFDYFSSLEGGVFDILSNQLPSYWVELFPHLTLNNLQRVKNMFNPVYMIEVDKSLQQIYYGAPGTGKSNTIKCETELAEKEGRVFRTTFHPDSDYSTFVGCYKPGMKSSDRIYSAEELAVKLKEIKNSGVTYPCHKFAAQYWRSLKDLSADTIKQILIACGFTESMNVEVSKGVAIGQEYLNKDDDGKIIYTFTPQAFTNAYVKAWNTEEDVYLIIEEINRGNCAQIFGDLFQLLDRRNGVSEYPIDADADLANYLSKKLAGSTHKDITDEIREGKKLKLPSNLYIWATMNTSDQSLFPIDSAFKRRWDWKYIPIKEHPDKNYKIEIGEKTYDWWGFLERINKVIGETTSSEDKKLGYFFVKTETSKVSDEQFVGKVLFYLWNDVFKNYGFDHTIFSKGDKDKFVFSDFFNADGTPNKDNVQLFLKRVEDAIKIDRPLDVTPKEGTTTVNEGATVVEA